MSPARGHRGAVKTIRAFFGSWTSATARLNTQALTHSQLPPIPATAISAQQTHIGRQSAMATSAGRRDVLAALLLMALVVLAAGVQSVDARSFGRGGSKSMRARVKNYMKKTTCVMNGVSVPPGSTRDVVVTTVKLTITIKVVVKGTERLVYSLPVSRVNWDDRDFLLEVNDCSACANCVGCVAGLLCLRVTSSGSERLRVCPIQIGAPGASPVPTPALPPVLPPVAAPPVAIPPVAVPPVSVPPLVPILGPIVAPGGPSTPPVLPPVGTP